ncbi:MAG: M15 family metallopeptidase [Cyanobacteria bacterium P01_E01_bin.6]
MVEIPDDIPEARRASVTSSTINAPSTAKRSSTQVSSAWWFGLALIALVSGSLSAWYLQEMEIISVVSPTPLTARAVLEDAFANTNIPAFSQRRSLLGHRQYEEAPPESLVSIVADGRIKLRDSAARSFSDMVAAARADDVIITPVSGFRSIEQQQYLFFGIKRESGQRAGERATVSAPPGYSEHHTGYAIDVIDGRQPEFELEEQFETTEAFAWLEENASFYSFELSFVREESATVNYEPWHWRFVGDTHSLETFYGTAPPSTTKTDEATSD